MKHVYKYDLSEDYNTGLELPGGEVLTVAYQGAQLVLWALVNPEVNTQRRVFFAVMTGEGLPVERSGVHYIGTATSPRGLVNHVFELLR